MKVQLIAFFSCIYGLGKWRDVEHKMYRTLSSGKVRERSKFFSSLFLKGGEEIWMIRRNRHMVMPVESTSAISI